LRFSQALVQAIRGAAHFWPSSAVFPRLALARLLPARRPRLLILERPHHPQV
jgi:hypothetical protein